MGKSGKHGDGKGKPALGVMGTLRIALKYWRPHWPIAALLLLMLAFQQGFKAFFALSLGMVVKMLGNGDAQGITTLIILLSFGFLLAGTATFVADFLGAKVGAAIINTIRHKMFRHLQHLSIGYYSQAQSGDIVARFTSDLADIQKGLTLRIIDAFVAVMGLAISIPAAFFTEWRLALAMILSLPLVGLGTRIFGKNAASSRYKLKQEEAGIAATVQENVRAQPVVKVFGLAGLLLWRFDRQLDKVGKRYVKAEYLAQLVGTASTLGVQAVQVVVIAFGAWLAVNGYILPGMLVAFITLQANISKDAYDLMKKVVPNLISSSGGLQRIEELLAEPLQITSRPGAPALSRIRGPIRFEQVVFSYGDGRPALQDVSFEIRPGEKVALVGPSGSGKSTVLQLLLRFYDPGRGRVTVDGSDLRAIDLAGYHSQIAAVFQDSLLFSGTVMENIRLGRLTATDEEIHAAARAAEIHDIVMGLPERYETAVGELGGRLSGGQRQRLSIARAMLRNPSILILDEATSALDPATESAVNATLDRVAQGRIVVSVTHRLASARNADRIIVMDQGQLAEMGSHDELLAKKGIYYGLWAKQNGIEVSDDGASAGIQPEWLSQVPIFAELDEAGRAAVSARLVSETVAQGRTVFREGEPGDRFYILARGKVEVVAGPDNRKLAVLTDGDFFGELSLIYDSPRNATVRALQPCVLLSLSDADFTQILDEHPEIRQRVEKTARKRRKLSLPEASPAPPPLPPAAPAAPEESAAWRPSSGTGVSQPPPLPFAAAEKAPPQRDRTVFIGYTAPSELRVEQGPDAGTSHKIQPNTRIGRSPENDIVLADKKASSQHAVLVATGIFLMLTDLESTNGTLLNGERVQHPVAVSVDDVIAIGDTVFRVS